MAGPAEKKNALIALRRYQTTQIVPSCFRVVALGQTTGAQTVARAELQALVVALEAVPTATVYTDCQSNVCLWEWVRKYELPRVAIAKRANEDLVGRLAVVATQPGQQVLKVRAHQNLEQIRDLYHLGNDIADEAAVGQIDLQIRQASCRIARDEIADKQELSQILDYSAQVLIEYSIRLKSLNPQLLHATPCGEDSGLPRLPDPASSFVIESDPALADCFMWGTAFYTSITKWLSLLAWPDQDLPSDPGISLLELLVNWLVCSGMEFPYVVPKGSDAPTNLAKDAYSIRTSAQDISVLLLPFSW